MPYIDRNKRTVDVTSMPGNAGELNYSISLMIHQYIQRKELSYSLLNEVIGVLECAKLELYRQVVTPYENKKKTLNGPVSELDR